MKSMKQYSILAAIVVLGLFAGCFLQPQDIAFQSQTTDGPVAWTDHSFANNPTDFQFAIVGDRTGGCRPGIFKKAMLQINLLQPEFVMSVGDLIEGGTEEIEPLKAEYDEIDTFLDSLDMRFFRVAGNHDIGNAVMADMYRERYGSPYYHFVYKDVLFLVVCTEDPPATSISDAQVSYMRKALQDNPNARWTLVFMHQPLFIEKEGKLHEDWAQIEGMLVDRPHTVFSGHFHNYTKHEKHGQKYFRLSTTGGGNALSGVPDGSFDHIMWVTMTDQGPRIANLMLDGIHDENVKVAE
jgi:Calcineurin-like phosphoesterase